MVRFEEIVKATTQGDIDFLEMNEEIIKKIGRDAESLYIVASSNNRKNSFRWLMSKNIRLPYPLHNLYKITFDNKSDDIVEILFETNFQIWPIIYSFNNWEQDIDYFESIFKRAYNKLDIYNYHNVVPDLIDICIEKNRETLIYWMIDNIKNVDAILMIASHFSSSNCLEYLKYLLSDMTFFSRKMCNNIIISSLVASSMEIIKWAFNNENIIGNYCQIYLFNGINFSLLHGHIEPILYIYSNNINFDFTDEQLKVLYEHVQYFKSMNSRKILIWILYKNGYRDDNNQELRSVCQEMNHKWSIFKKHVIDNHFLTDRDVINLIAQMI